jgi:crotonobetaine/carnitine-CoA ligase
VEAAVAGHPSVHTVAALPVPDSLRDEEVMVCVVLVPGAAPDRATAASIFALCYERLAYFKAPGWIVFRDILPTTTTSKIQKSLIFEPNEEPTATPRSFDFRPDKKRPIAARV